MAQLALGLVALLAPDRGSRLLGLPAGGPETAFAWRLFAARQVCLGAGGAAGLRAAREVNVALQPIDLLVFAHAYRAGDVPRRVAGLGLGSASFALATALACRRADPSPQAIRPR